MRQIDLQLASLQKFRDHVEEVVATKERRNPVEARLKRSVPYSSTSTRNPHQYFPESAGGARQLEGNPTTQARPSIKDLARSREVKFGLLEASLL